MCQFLSFCFHILRCPFLLFLSCSLCHARIAASALLLSLFILAFALVSSSTSLFLAGSGAAFTGSGSVHLGGHLLFHTPIRPCNLDWVLLKQIDLFSAHVALGSTPPLQNLYRHGHCSLLLQLETGSKSVYQDARVRFFQKVTQCSCTMIFASFISCDGSAAVNEFRCQPHSDEKKVPPSTIGIGKKLCTRPLRLAPVPVSTTGSGCLLLQW